MKHHTRAWLWTTAFALAALLLCIWFWPTLRDWAAVLSVPVAAKRLSAWAASLGWLGVLLLFLLQIAQIVIAVLPGGLVELAGGALYGPIWGFLIALAGILAGTMAAFWISRGFGEPLVRKLINSAQFDRYAALCKKPQFEAVALLFFFLPGVPKDVLVYVIGCSGVISRRFALRATLARIPSVAVSSFAGAMFGEGNFSLFALVYLLFLTAGAIGALLHRTLLKRIEK